MSFSKDIQDNRFDRELELLEELKSRYIITTRRNALGLSVKVNVRSDPSIDNLIFEIHMHGKYPLHAPKLMFESIDSFPSLADGRDFLEDILLSK